jgi:hypothetical protein
VGGGHDEAEEHGVPGRAARAHEVCGHDGLAVAGLERVERAEARGDREGKQDHANAQRPIRDQRREGRTGRAGHGHREA